MNIFVTSEYPPDLVGIMLDQYVGVLTPNDTLMTTSSEYDELFIEYAISYGANLKVYSIDKYSAEHTIESIAKEIDELLIFSDVLTFHLKHLYKYCSNQVILDHSNRMTFDDYKKSVEENFENKCEKLRKRKMIFNYHDHFINEVVRVLEKANRVKITIKEMNWLNV